MSRLLIPPDEIRTGRLLTRRYRLDDGPSMARAVSPFTPTSIAATPLS